jgi:protein tyrosine/serine phosphatase
MMKRFLQTSMAALIVVFSFATFTFGQTTAPKAFTNINIGNFGQMDENFYRGAQPNPGDYKSLADLGIKTIVDLRDDPTDYERSAAEAVGLKYVNIPMSGWKSPKDTDINTFLKLANDPSTGPMFVHCKAGIHRTGVAGAVYRFTKYGWDYDKAYQEMKNYNFTSGLVHGSLKTFVKNYATRFEHQSPTASVQTAAHVN